MKKIVFLICIFILLFSSSVLSFETKAIVSPQDKINGFVIVKKGWTLSGIAESVFGDYKKYEYLAKINNLENPNIIEVGQKIWFREKVVISKKDRFEIAKRVVRNSLEKSLKFRYGKNYTWEMKRSDIKRKLTNIDVSNPSWKVQNQLKEIIIELEWLDKIQIYSALISLIDNPDRLLFQTAIAEQESHYRNVHGQHGEKGPFQIKPRTAFGFLKKEFKRITLAETSDILEDIDTNTFVSTELINEYLDNCEGDYFRALERYNAGIKKREYAREVLSRYDRMKSEYEDLLYEFSQKN